MNESKIKNKKIKRIITIIIILGILTSLTVINIIKRNKVETKTSQIKICTTFYPEYLLVNNLVKNITNIEVINITNNVKGCIHDYALTTNDMKNISDSDIVILNGAQMESFFNDYINKNKNLNVVDSSINTTQIIDESKHEINSHIYLDIENYIIQLNNIYKALVKLNFTESDKNIIKDNKDKYIKKLNELKKYSEKLNNIKQSNVVLSHDSFLYITKKYNIKVVNILEEEHETEIDSKTLANIININKTDKIDAIFISKDFDISRIQGLINETNINVYTLDAITAKENTKDYIEIMMQNIDIIYNVLKK